ncbi:MAG: peptidoglycan-binding domain-containing protein, partial [Patescibacteria group bacterium]|nr:peptidoglycan-binding domain-containing protein [Patescibacteria group bacterium]
GSGVLKLKFEGLAGLNYKVPYLTQDENEYYSIGFIELDENQSGEIYISDFNSKNKALIILPSLQTKILGFSGNEGTYPFTFEASIVKSATEQKQEQELIEKLLEQISFLQAEILKVQAEINAILEKRNNVSLQEIKNNLYFGLENNSEVSFLQSFLKSQGQDIYPEGLVTGNFLSMTKEAVIRFQEKYSQDVLDPLGLKNGTGYVGSKTIAKINEILHRDI